jgi:hypothetical protein
MQYFSPNTGSSMYGPYVTSHSCQVHEEDDAYAFVSGHMSLYTYHLLGVQVREISFFALS